MFHIVFHSSYTVIFFLLEVSLQRVVMHYHVLARHTFLGLGQMTPHAFL